MTREETKKQPLNLFVKSKQGDEEYKVMKKTYKNYSKREAQMKFEKCLNE